MKACDVIASLYIQPLKDLHVVSFLCVRDLAQEYQVYPSCHYSYCIVIAKLCCFMTRDPEAFDRRSDPVPEHGTNYVTVLL